MLHFKNLAQVKGFSRDVNYTGIILDNWNDPFNLIPVVLTILCLLNGLPRGFQAWWVLANAVIFHPMDLYASFFVVLSFFVVVCCFNSLFFTAVLWVHLVEDPSTYQTNML